MSIPGKSILSLLSDVTKGSVKDWYNKAIPTLATKIAAAYGSRNEIAGPGSALIFTSGTETTTACLLNMATGELVLDGNLLTAAALADKDVLTEATTVGQPILEDGATGESVFTLASDEAIQMSLIACNSDGAGGVVADGGTPLIVAVISGTDQATAKAATAPPSSAQIQAALEASTGVHAGVTGWVWLAQVEFNNPSGTPGSTIVGNRNNILGA